MNINKSKAVASTHRLMQLAESIFNIIRYSREILNKTTNGQKTA